MTISSNHNQIQQPRPVTAPVAVSSFQTAKWNVATILGTIFLGIIWISATVYSSIANEKFLASYDCPTANTALKQFGSLCWCLLLGLITDKIGFPLSFKVRQLSLKDNHTSLKKKIENKAERLIQFSCEWRCNCSAQQSGSGPIPSKKIRLNKKTEKIENLNKSESGNLNLNFQNGRESATKESQRKHKREKSTNLTSNKYNSSESDSQSDSDKTSSESDCVDVTNSYNNGNDLDDNHTSCNQNRLNSTGAANSYLTQCLNNHVHDDEYSKMIDSNMNDYRHCNDDHLDSPSSKNKDSQSHINNGNYNLNSNLMHQKHPSGQKQYLNSMKLNQNSLSNLHLESSTTLTRTPAQSRRSCSASLTGVTEYQSGITLNFNSNCNITQSESRSNINNNIAISESNLDESNDGTSGPGEKVQVYGPNYRGAAGSADSKLDSESGSIVTESQNFSDLTSKCECEPLLRIPDNEANFNDGHQQDLASHVSEILKTLTIIETNVDSPSDSDDSEGSKSSQLTHKKGPLVISMPPYAFAGLSIVLQNTFSSYATRHVGTTQNYIVRAAIPMMTWAYCVFWEKSQKIHYKTVMSIILLAIGLVLAIPPSNKPQKTQSQSDSDQYNHNFDILWAFGAAFLSMLQPIACKNAADSTEGSKQLPGPKSFSLIMAFSTAIAITMLLIFSQFHIIENYFWKRILYSTGSDDRSSSSQEKHQGFLSSYSSESDSQDITTNLVPNFWSSPWILSETDASKFRKIDQELIKKHNPNYVNSDLIQMNGHPPPESDPWFIFSFLIQPCFETMTCFFAEWLLCFLLSQKVSKLTYSVLEPGRRLCVIGMAQIRTGWTLTGLNLVGVGITVAGGVMYAWISNEVTK